MPGCWEDLDGAAHFDVPAIHDLYGIPNTPEQIEDTQQMLAQLLAEMLPGVKITLRDTTDD